MVGTMLSPEAERVLRYLVEVEELAEEVLADKRQVGGPSAALGPGFARRGLAASAVGPRAGFGIRLQRGFPVGWWAHGRDHRRGAAGRQGGPDTWHGAALQAFIRTC